VIYSTHHVYIIEKYMGYVSTWFPSVLQHHMAEEKTKYAMNQVNLCTYWPALSPTYGKRGVAVKSSAT